MKILLAILIIILSLQSWTKADDIRDFEIDGISIGDSLLKYADKETIVKNSNAPYKSKKFVMFSDYFPEISIYDGYLAHYKKEDTKFIIEDIQGVILYENNYSECLNRKKLIINELNENFKNLKQESWEQRHKADKTGKSITNSTEYTLKTGFFRITCNDWSEDMDYVDKLTVSIVTNEFDYWINNEAY